MEETKNVCQVNRTLGGHPMKQKSSRDTRAYPRKDAADWEVSRAIVDIATAQWGMGSAKSAEARLRRALELVPDHLENQILAELGDVFPVAGDQGGSGISGGEGDQGIECQILQVIAWQRHAFRRHHCISG